VTDEWLAKRERTVTEADALVLAATLTPACVPAVLDVDRQRCVLTLASAPPGWVTWKARLLDGIAETAIASSLGRLLATWHSATFDDDAVARRFTDYESFEQLRIDPFYRTLASRRPSLAPAIHELIRCMQQTRKCLVHGDYSPKNVLVGDGLWVIDFEVAHYGDPVFDVAFMLHHLLLKMIHVPAAGAELEACTVSFWNSYREAVSADLLADVDYIVGHVGALMVARVDAKSPADYLVGDERQAAREAGSRLLLQAPDSFDRALEIVRTARS
jgi:tRNA A-37 threonylcarbamoyl transferase component Bud32